MTLFDRVFGGNDYNYARTVAAIDEAIAANGEGCAVSFPSTAYNLPCYYGITGKKINTLGELKAALENDIKPMMTRNNRLQDAFDSGVASALCAEFLEVLKYLNGAEPYAEPEMGHLTDAFVRNLGVPLVTGDIPGVAVIIGGAEDPAETVALAKEYQAQGILVTLTGDAIKHCYEAGMKLGEGVRVVPLGYEMQSVIHVVSVAVRAALIFGNIQPGDYKALYKYTMDRVRAFVNAYKPLSDEIVSYGAGAICLGFPVISNETENMFRVPKSLIQQLDTTKWNATSLEARDIKLKITKIDIPVSFATAFEGEIIRRGDMQVEVDGSRVDCFELVQTKEAAEVEDHKITVIGPEIDEIPVGSKISLSYTVNVAGKAMQSDFESVMERKFHSWINCIEGVMHTGQRDMIRIRISKADFEAGFKFKHIGEVLYAKVKNEFEAVVDKCEVVIIVDAEKNKELRAAANEVFNKRDARLASMTDESVDTFYTCIMCQAFSPSHVCIVTPERLGLCGAVSWLDAKATKELDPAGPCQPIVKEGCQDEKLGRYDSMDAAVNKYSQGAVERITLYSLFQDPMTSCGCFECICGVEPVSMGVVITCREHAGMTPLGMSFSEMASMTGGGVQTPGFMGHGKHFISSKKFIAAEGGPGRIVWMPKMLKDQMRERLDATALEMYGVENFTDMIADETVCTEDPEELLNYLSEVGHPVLGFEPFDM
ncbi:MAG: CO dehydrogenase/CO-methylating acetyl-CoA synthase complex subunit beta [Oscillospiraceae bacterium]|nr:CO dehydrogenase/CO-methylating acetyl-CoA synthase complex subunit beta [Oscillospiraceae bacterium]